MRKHDGAHHNKKYDSDNPGIQIKLLVISCAVSPVHDNNSDTVKCVKQNESKKKPFQHRKEKTIIESHFMLKSFFTLR